MIKNFKKEISYSPENLYTLVHSQDTEIQLDMDQKLYRIYIEQVPKKNNAGQTYYIRKYIEVIVGKKDPTDSLSLLKRKVIEEINEYDCSPSVNQFYLNGAGVWLDKNTRIGLMNSTKIQKNLGIKKSILWLGGNSIEIDCDLAISLLSNLEIYALSCFDNTEKNKKEVSELDREFDVVNFDYTKGYPEKLHLNTN